MSGLLLLWRWVVLLLLLSGLTVVLGRASGRAGCACTTAVLCGPAGWELCPGSVVCGTDLCRDFAVGVVGAAGQHQLLDYGDLPRAVVASAAIPLIFSRVDVPGGCRGRGRRVQAVSQPRVADHLGGNAGPAGVRALHWCHKLRLP